MVNRPPDYVNSFMHTPHLLNGYESLKNALLGLGSWAVRIIIRNSAKCECVYCECLVNAMHITASVFINDDESGLHHDFETWLERLAPEKPYSQYRHNGFEDNADAHLKRSVMGREVVVAVTGGKLDFGPWEQIFYGEFDGHRRKRVLVKIIGE